MFHSIVELLGITGGLTQKSVIHYVLLLLQITKCLHIVRFLSVTYASTYYTEMRLIYKNAMCFLCAKLIEELGGARNVKFGTQVINNETRREFENLSEMFTPRRDR